MLQPGVIAAAVALSAAGFPLPAPLPHDVLQAVEASCMDYLDGQLSGDVARVERVLHPDLAKRRVLPGNAMETLALRRMGRDELVALTRQGALVAPPAQWKRQCTVLDVEADIAVVRAETPIFVDYLQLGRFDGRWVVVSALWHVRPAEERRALEAGVLPHSR